MLRKNILANLNNIKNKLSERDSLLPTKVSGNRVYKDNNGIPLDIVDNVTRGNQLATQVGDMVVFNKSYNHGTIDDYDNASNAVGIKYGDYGEIWFNADTFIKL